MRELPILFKTEMVQSNIAGNKNQTRRTAGLEKVNENPDDWTITEDWSDKGVLFFNKNGYSDRMKPRYQKGDHIWVKETFCEPVLFDGVEKDYYYKADYPNGIDCDIDSKHVSGKWKSSLFMPKVAARIWLECTGVRCERLHDISEQDAINEGIKVIEKDEAYFDYEFDGKNGSCATARGSFFSLWQKINGEESYKSNPWVFIYDFKRIER